jgi:CubicO group peptidase (beta-lactamase class C family)
MTLKHMILAGLAVVLAGCSARPRALPTAAPSQNGLIEAELARMGPALQAFVDSGKVGGIYAVIARNGHISYEQTFGWADIERRRPLERDAVFRIFSMTKPVVAAGALKLVDQGKISLDDPVSKYIPSFANVRVFAGGTADAPITQPADSAMTIRHLLVHTNGLAYGLTHSPVDSIFARAALYNPAWTLAAFADSVARLPLHFSPGTRWSYSSAIDIVGRVIEVASGQTLDVFLHEQIFRPLGMHDTSFRWTEDLLKRATTLYQPGPNGTLQVVTGGLMRMYEPEARFLWGSGGLLSTPDDYLRFAQMLLNRGQFNGVRVLSESSVAEMTRNQLSPQLMAQVRSMLDAGYGFGLAGSVLVDPNASDMPGAAGIYRWSGYVGTYFWIDPRNQLLAMIWTQLSPGNTYPLEDEFQRMVYRALQQ